MEWLTRRTMASVLALALITPSSAASESFDVSPTLEVFVDGVIKPLMKANNTPSGTVAISKDGKLILAKGYGFQDIKQQIPVDPNHTLFRPGSVSKLFTWVAVMQLVEQNKLDLDTDVNDYLRTFSISDSFDKPITLRHIMTHTSGFEDGALGYLIIVDPAQVIPLSEAMARYQPERVNPPGVQTAYSNYATSLAGLIVSNISGLPFTDYIQQNIFSRLDMNNSTFVEPLPPHLAEQMAVSYTVEGGAHVEKPFELISNFAPAGALSSTSVDMLKFAQAMLNGGELNGRRILQQKTVDEMLTRNFSHDERLMGMALGFYESDLEGNRIVGHGGDTFWFHSSFGIDQKHGLAFFVSFGGPSGAAVRGSFLPAFYRQFFPRDEKPPTPPEGFSKRANRYAGTYGFWRSNFSTIEKVLGLAGGVQVVPTTDNTLMISAIGKTKQYSEIEQNLFREVDSSVSITPDLSPRLLAFQENDEGEITGFVMDGVPFMSLRKLPFYATPNFNFTLLGLSMLVFLWVLLRRFFQRSNFKLMTAPERSSINAANYCAAANLLVLICGVIVISSVADEIFSEIPTVFKLWLILPIVASLAGIYLLYHTVNIWREGTLGSAWVRARFSVIAVCAIFMCWFYFYWNIIGFQYL